MNQLENNIDLVDEEIQNLKSAVEDLEKIVNGKEDSVVVTLEENVASGAYGEKVRAYLGGMDNAPRLLTINIPDEYVEHGNVEILKKEIGIDSETIRNKILEIVQK